MASFAFNEAMRLMQLGTLRLGSDTIKIMLVNSVYIPTQDDVAVDLGSGTGIVTCEIDVTNCTKGPSGTNRKGLTTGSMTFVKNNTTDRSTFSYVGALSWVNVGSGGAIYAAVVYQHLGTDDLVNIPIYYLQLEALVNTNGANFDLQVSPSGIHYIQN